MSDLLVDLETFFTSLGIAVSGKFFRDTMPNDPDVVATVYEYSGANDLPQINEATRNIQIVARDKSATQAKLKAREYYHALVTDSGIIDITDSRRCAIHLKQAPFKIKVDDSFRVYYGFNAMITTYND